MTRTRDRRGPNAVPGPNQRRRPLTKRGSTQRSSPTAGELFGFARRSLGDNGLAEEAVQETFMRAWRSRHRFDPGLGSLRNWLFAIERRVVIDLAHKRSSNSTDELVEDPTAVDNQAEQAMLGWQVEEALRRLRPEHRAVVLDIYFRNLPGREVAARLGVPEGTVRSRLFYALAVAPARPRGDGVGAMSNLSCETGKRADRPRRHWDRLPERERLALESHLDGCEECRASSPVSTGWLRRLSAAEPDRIDHVLGVPESASHLRYSDSLGTEVARHRRSTRMRFAPAAAVVLLGSRRRRASPPTVLVGYAALAHCSHLRALRVRRTLHATARLTSETWGTSVELRACGQQGGQMLTVSMRPTTESGGWRVRTERRRERSGRRDDELRRASSLDRRGAGDERSQGQQVLEQLQQLNACAGTDEGKLGAPEH